MKFFPFFFLVAIATIADAQPTANPIISPEVHADRTVIFRLLAPNAKEVQVSGEFTSKPLSMTKDEKGIWSVTTETLEPNTYGYNFVMDGLTMPDPNNTHVRVGALWFATQVDVPGEKPAFFAAQDVPHGTLHGHWYYSKALNTVRRVNVYTPPGYSGSAEKPYPVLYLLHGFGDDEGFWTQVGYANFIMDNLLAEGKTKPALIVMPFGHSTRSVHWPRGPGDAAFPPGPRGGPAFGVEMLEKDLLENVIPLVEKEYRVGKDSDQRAIAGLSMGGYQALSIGFNNPQYFAYVGAFSSALISADFVHDFQAILADHDKSNKEFKLIWIGCGSDDKLLSGNKQLEKTLSARGINHQWTITPGYGHAWTLWRVYLRDLLPKLFDGDAVAMAAPLERTRIISSFDQDWRFLKADAPGAEKSDFDDSAWRTLNVPHDWSIEGPFDEKNPNGGAGGFLPAGAGWYRKHFTLPADFAQRRVFVEFDGVMANSEVWINGQQLGKRPYGYVSFRYDLTGKLDFGPNKPNILIVRVDNSAQPASRWYSGAGIYRHVRLVATDPVHIDQWSTFVTTPKIESDLAIVRVQTTVVNQSDVPREVSLQIGMVSPDDKTVQTADTQSQTIPAGKSADFKQEITVKNPQLWDLDHPVLYHANVKVRSGNAAIDDEAMPFGIRDLKFEPATGFWLNGKNFKIKGICLHQDGGAMGIAVPLGIWQQRLEALKQIGVNGIRTAHNPVAPEFLDLCDRMGLLVMDEFFDCWTVGKNRYDYHLYFNEWSKIDAADTIRRDRNHPSVILYSVGNEIHDTPKEELAKGILKSLVEVCHENDPTRPVTQALFRPNVSHDYDNGLADMLDVIGTNYRDAELLAAYQAKPTRKIIGTEQGHDRKIWLTCRDNPPEAGQFLWTGIDYLGESRGWPIVVAGSGLLDINGQPKPMAFERQSWWSEKPMVRIARRVASARATTADPGFEPLNRRQTQFCDWTPQDTDPHEENLEVYSNCDEVELLLNDKSLGSKPRNADDGPRIWKVAFEPGTIKAIAKNKGQVVANDELQTAGIPAKIVLAADRNKLSTDWDDVCCVTAVVTDENGVLNPRANDLISFSITGPGVIAAIANGNRSSHALFQSSPHRAFQGQCMVIVKAGAGEGRQITLSASAPGLGKSTITIESIALPAKNSVATETALPAPSQPASDQGLPTLFLIGDSTVRNGTDRGDDGLWGWGHPIVVFFDKTKINVQNRAMGGLSSRTFQTAGLWDKVLSAIKPGDFVMMQFGHNDGGPLNTGRARASLKGNGEETKEVEMQATGKKEVVHTYGWYMRKYVADAKAKGATPIVISQIPRNMWTDGKVNRVSKDYGKWAAEGAKEGGAFFIDLNEIVAKHYDLEGPEKVGVEYFTTKDHTHTTAAGARLNAECVIEGLKELKDCPLLNYLSAAPEHWEPTAK